MSGALKLDESRMSEYSPSMQRVLKNNNIIVLTPSEIKRRSGRTTFKKPAKSENKIILFSKNKREVQRKHEVKDVKINRRIIAKPSNKGQNLKRKRTHRHTKSIRQINKEQKQAKKEQEKRRKELAKEFEKERVKEYKQIRKDRKEAKKEERKKRKIAKANLKYFRFTEPKERSWLNRYRIQRKYEKGRYDLLEEDYYNHDITLEEIQISKDATKRRDRKLYKLVQEYEDAREDVSMRKQFVGLRVGLATLLLCANIGLTNHIITDIKAHAPQPEVIVTIDEADREQVSNAGIQLLAIKQETGYNFENLTVDEQLDAVLRLPSVEKKIAKGRCWNATLNLKDQELLDQIVIDTYGQEKYDTFTEMQKFDLRVLAYNMLDKEKQDNLRDPLYIRQRMAEQEAEKMEREKNLAEIEARFNHTEDEGERE